MIYLDTGCLVKLYYPEPESQRVAMVIRGQSMWYTPLHELELTNALSLKVFYKGATSAQVAAALGLVAQDLRDGVLVPFDGNWKGVFVEAARLAEQYTPSIGCRSLDILHCAAAKASAATAFLTTDGRQRKLAEAMGLNVANL